MSNYDVWKTGDYGNDLVDMSYECPICEQHEESKFRAKEFFEDVLKILYSKDTIDLPELENSLDEIAGYFDIPLPHEVLEIARPKMTSRYIVDNMTESHKFIHLIAK